MSPAVGFRKVWSNRARVLALVVLTAVAPGATSAASSPSVIRVEMSEFAFHPAVIRLAAGKVAVIDLVNRGQLAHQLDAPVLRRVPVTLVDGSIQVEATGLEFVRVQPGRRARVSYALRSHGRFRFTCSIEGHAEAGMVGVLEVR